jgi:hypothetical protein
VKRIAMLLALCLCARARADEDAVAGARAAAVGGLVTALGTSIAGGVMVAAYSSLETKIGGVELMTGGLAGAPMIAHGREWKRGLLFSVVPTISAIAMAALLVDRPQVFVEGGKRDQRWGFAILLGISYVSSGIGLIDGVGSIERARRRTTAHNLAFAPLLGPDRAGILLGGPL